MTKPTNRKKRNRATRILLSPIIVIIFIVGWSLYYIGQSNHKQKQKPTIITPTKQKELELILIPKEEQTLTA